MYFIVHAALVRIKLMMMMINRHMNSLLPPAKRRGNVFLCGCMYMYVCNTITFESFDVESSFVVIRCILRQYGSSSCRILTDRMVTAIFYN